MKTSLPYIICISLILLVGGTFTGLSSGTPTETLIITGNGGAIGVMKRMADGFRKRHPDVTVNILPSIGSTGGIAAVKAGKIHIGLSARSLKTEERIPGIIEEAYGRTAFIFGVQESNPIEGLSLTEIEEIYAGKRKTWSDGTLIRIILRPLYDCYSTFLAGISPGMASASEQAHSIRGAFVGMTDDEAAVQIEKTPGSFGTISAAIAAVEKVKIKPISVDGVAPTLQNVAAGTYPYAMTMSVIYLRDRYRGAVKDFLDFVFSDDGRKILSVNGHVPLPRMAGK